MATNMKSNISNFLKKINSIPFSFTTNHYFVFKNSSLKDGELNSKESWDVLRENDDHFSISESREEWISVNENLVKKDGQDGALIGRAEQIVELLKWKNIEELFSVGSGGAGLEYHVLKRMPDLRLTCSEYSPKSVEVLRNVFTECEAVIEFDAVKSNWADVVSVSNITKQIILMYRIDIHLTDIETEQMFKKMYEAGIENVIIVLCGVVTVRGFINRLIQRLTWKLSGEKLIFAGYLRSEASFEKFWSKYYQSEGFLCGGLPSYLLKKRQK
jgi:hypothetical protein